MQPLIDGSLSTLYTVRMFRPRPLFPLLALGAAAALLTACNSGPYRHVYSPQRNFYKPLPERSTAADMLPAESTTTTTTTATVTPPASPITGGVESLPQSSSSTTPPTLPAGGAVPPAIPGLDPIPAAQ